MNSPVYILRLLFKDGAKETELQIPKDQISFSVAESIHSLYPVANIVMKDPSGILKETGMLVYGRVVIIEFGTPEIKAINRSEYVITDSKIAFSSGPGGDITLTLLPSIFAKQRLKTKAYRNKSVSAIAKEILNTYGDIKLDYFEDAEYIDTVWYQTEMTDMKFIESVLLKNAFSKGSAFTPYYAFFTSNGRFSFSSYQNMKKTSATTNTTEDRLRIFRQVYAESSSSGMPVMTDSTEVANNSNYVAEVFKVLSVEKLATSGFDIFKWLKRQVRVIDFGNPQDTPELGEDIEASLSLYNSEAAYKYKGMLYDTNDTVSNTHRDVYIRSNHTPEEDTYLTAQILQQKAQEFFTDRYSLRITLNPFIHAGDSIIFSVQAKEMPTGILKSQFGVFTVEMVEHIWSKEENTPPQSKLIIGRPALDFINLPEFRKPLDDSSFKEKWYNGEFTYDLPTNKYFKVKGTKYDRY